jgi:hypothetical protein
MVLEDSRESERNVDQTGNWGSKCVQHNETDGSWEKFVPGGFRECWQMWMKKPENCAQRSLGTVWELWWEMKHGYTLCGTSLEDAALITTTEQRLRRCSRALQCWNTGPSFKVA